MFKLKEKVKTAPDDKKLARLEKGAEKYKSFHTQYTLYTNQEEKWYYMTLERVQTMRDKTTVEILRSLLPNVEYHYVIKKRMLQSIKKLKEKSCDKTIEEGLKEIMQDYIDKEVESAVKQLERNDKGDEQQQENLPTLVNEVLNKSKSDHDQQKTLSVTRKPILREGHEREWIERAKVLMTEFDKKTSDEKLKELMPLVRNHQDIKNAIKSKRMRIRQGEKDEPIGAFLNRLLQLYGPNKRRCNNKKIRCNKCHKRGHVRKSCPHKKGNQWQRTRRHLVGKKVILEN